MLVAMSATFHLERRKLSYAEELRRHETVKRLRTDKDGVVSFEYVIVAACVVARSGCCVRYWCTSGYREGADRRDHRDRHRCHCGLVRPSDSRGALGCAQCPPFLRHAFDELDCSHSFVSGNTIVGYMLQ